MRTIMALLVWMCLASTVQASTWYRIGPDPRTGVVGAIDGTSLVRGSKTVTVLIRFYVVPGKVKPVSASRATYTTEIDCDLHRHRFLNSSAVNPEGRTVAETKIVSPWENTAPNGFGALMFGAACAPNFPENLGKPVDDDAEGKLAEPGPEEFRVVAELDAH